MFILINIALVCVLPQLTIAESEDVLKLQLITIKVIDNSKVGIEQVSHINAGTVCIGTPCQNFTVMLDSGSSDLWVASTRCVSPTCAKQHRFNEKKSSTYRPSTDNFTIKYATGDLKGAFGFDNVNLAGITVQNQKFGQALTSADTFANAGLDGILGLGLPGLARGNSIPLFITMVNQKVVRQPVFTFCRSRESDDVSVNELILGGSDPSRYVGDKMVYANVSGNTYWKFTIGKISVNGDDSVCPDGCTAVADSGTTLIRGPKDIIDELNSLVGATFYKSTQYKIDCDLDKSPNVEFVIEGKSFILTPDDYVIPLSSTVCLTGFAITQSKTANFLILGSVFLNGRCTQFDFGNRRLGFVSIK